MTKQENPKSYRDRCTDIDGTVIEKEYLRLSSDQAHWGKRRADAGKAVADLKIDLAEAENRVKEIHALQYLRFREELATLDSRGNPKPPTEATINSNVLASPEYRDAMAAVFDLRRELADAQHALDQVSSTVAAIDTKKEMLISIGADRRKELESDVHLRRMARETRKGDEP